MKTKEIAKPLSKAEATMQKHNLPKSWDRLFNDIKAGYLEKQKQISEQAESPLETGV